MVLSVQNLTQKFDEKRFNILQYGLSIQSDFLNKNYKQSWPSAWDKKIMILKYSFLITQSTYYLKMYVIKLSGVFRIFINACIKNEWIKAGLL